MSTPRFYSWDDDGSPGRALTGNLQNRLKQILVPCLVTGYGSKPGAGWTIGHEHANGFSLLNADGNVVNFVSNLPAQAPYPAISAQAIHIYAAESITDVSGAIIDGANLCSGNFRKGLPELASYPRHNLGYAGYALVNQVISLQWTLIADDKTFILNCSTLTSNLATNAGVNYSFTIYAGAAVLDNEVTGNFIVLAGDIVAYNGTPANYAFSRGYSSPINLSTGLAENAVVGSEPYANSFSSNPTGQSTKPLARLNLQQPRLFFDSDFIGCLRGVVYDDVLRLYGWEEHLKVLGFSGTDFTDRGKLVLIDGYNYAFARSFSGNSILTDNSAFW